jgi:hypothetical protein
MREEGFTGYDIVAGVARLAAMNLYLHRPGRADTTPTRVRCPLVASHTRAGASFARDSNPRIIGLSARSRLSGTGRREARPAQGMWSSGTIR